MTGRSGIALFMLALAACSQSEAPEDVPALPAQTAETANELMREAERAAGNAAARSETVGPTARSNANNKEEERP